MRRLAPLAISAAAGIALALAVSGLPARAASASITAEPTDSWNPADVTITVGDSVTWTNGGGFHNVCVLKPGGSGDTCSGNPDAVFRNGDPSSDWSSYTNSFTFTTAGSYTYFCEVHKSLGMIGTITVQPADTGTTATAPTATQPTTQPTVSQPTDTTTSQTQTQTQSTPADTLPPSFVGKARRRASRTALVLAFSSSEAGKLQATVERRLPHARRFTRIGEALVHARAGRNVVTLSRRVSGRLRSGSYRVRLELVDAAGNHSAPATLAFKLN